MIHAQETSGCDRELDPLVVAQQPLSNAADKIYALWLSDNLSDFGGLSLADDNSKVILYWKEGQLPPAMSSLVTDLWNTVTIEVVNTAYSLAEFEAESKRLIELGRVDTVVVNEAGPSPDFSSLSVGINTNVDEREADKLSSVRQAITSTRDLVGFRRRPTSCVT